MPERSFLDWMIPGLFGPIPSAGMTLETPVLNRWLGIARRQPGPGTDPLTTLCACFGILRDPEQDPPSAALCWQGEGRAPHPAVLHADPVHLHPEGGSLWLLAPELLDPQPEEARALAQAFNQHFSHQGFRLETPHPRRWYLVLDQAPRIRTTPLHEAWHRPIDALLPRGEEALFWHRLLNEVQMLFHPSPVNQRRERAGQPPINSIWLWGGGQLPDAPAEVPYERIYGDAVLVRGLARWAGVPWNPLPESPKSLLVEGASRVLLYWEDLWQAVLAQDAAAWVQAVQRLEAWASQMPRGVHLHILPCTGESWHLIPGRWRDCWRRPKPLLQHLSS